LKPAASHAAVREPVLIVGQGIAGTLLAWELEQAGVPFRIVDAGHAGAVSRIAAGLVNPIAGRRLVKSWRAEELIPLARERYRSLEAALGIPLWREVRIRRLYRDSAERDLIERRREEGSLSPYLGSVDDAGFWIVGAACVDLPALLSAARARWIGRGLLVETRFDSAQRERHGSIVYCTGAAVRLHPALENLPWQVSRGEVLTIAATGLDAGVVRSRNHWLLPTGSKRAKVGASYAWGVCSDAPTPEAREALSRSAGELMGGSAEIFGHEAGFRLALPDKRPLAGWMPGQPGNGVCSALGSKGVLWAPWLARQWRENLLTGAPFGRVCDIRRFLDVAQKSPAL
jgi:glycine oxidase